MSESFKNLYVATLDRDAHSKTCGYWYLVQSSHTAHTAFARRESLMQWLMERGLELSEPLADHGTHSWQKVNGEYRRQAHMSYDEFFALKGERSRTLSNGDWVVTIITTDEDGIKTVHTLNPNCRDRQVFDYNESRALFG